jgi:dipeptidyl aminopeptidase/acylaminoacyl peptidase
MEHGSARVLRGCVVVLCLVIAATSSGTPNDVIPTAHFFGSPTIQAVGMSPDGKYIAYGLNGDLAVMRADTREGVSLFNVTHREEIHAFWWVGDDRFIFSTARPVMGRPVLYWTGNYYIANVHGPAIEQFLAPDHFRVYTIVSTPFETPGRVLVGWHGFEDATGWFNIDHGATPGAIVSAARRSERSPVRGGSAHPDRYGNVRLVVGGSRPYRILHRRDNASDWQDVSEAFAYERDHVFRPRGFRDDGALYFLSSRDGATVGLHTFDFESGAFSLLYRHDRYDIDGVVWNAARTRIVAVQYHGEYPATVFLDPDDPETQVLRNLVRSFPGYAVDFLAASRDGRRRLLRVHSDRNPGTAFLFDGDRNAASFLFASRPELDEQAMAHRVPFKVMADDGLEIPGYLTMPPHAKGPVPLLVLLHGGPHTVRDRWNFDAEAQFYAHRGYAVLQVNFRGSGGYGRPFEEAGYLNWGDLIIEDILTATRWALGQPEIDATRACVGGASFGAYAAMMAVVRAPGTFRCAIGIAGAYDLELVLSASSSMELALGRDRRHLRSISPVHLADRLTVPIFIAHGAQDERTPLAHARRLRTALRRAGNDPEWHVENREGHGFFGEAQQVALYDAIVAFMERHLAVDEATLASAEME